jgi:hypothetical protein
MFPVAVATHGSARHSGLHGLSVHTFKIRLGNLGVTLPTRRRNVPVVDGGMRILRRKDSVASMTIRATRRSPVAVGHRSSMHALSIEFHRTCEGYLVPGKKLLIAMARCASVGQVFLGAW